MIRWVLAAGLLAAVSVPPATAADLGDGSYGDPRYRDYEGPPPQSYYDDDDDDGADEEVGRRRYSYAPRRYSPDGDHRGCVRSEQVRRHLTRDGWRDFHGGKPVSETVVKLRARRPSGWLFELRLDRCSGEILAARPLQLRPFGPYAYREPYGPYGRWGWGPETRRYDGDPRYERPYAYRSPRHWDRD